MCVLRACGRTKTNVPYSCPLDTPGLVLVAKETPRRQRWFLRAILGTGYWDRCET